MRAPASPWGEEAINRTEAIVVKGKPSAATSVAWWTGEPIPECPELDGAGFYERAAYLCRKQKFQAGLEPNGQERSTSMMAWKRRQKRAFDEAN